MMQQVTKAQAVFLAKTLSELKELFFTLNRYDLLVKITYELPFSTLFTRVNVWDSLPHVVHHYAPRLGYIMDERKMLHLELLYAWTLRTAKETAQTDGFFALGWMTILYDTLKMLPKEEAVTDSIFFLLLFAVYGIPAPKDGNNYQTFQGYPVSILRSSKWALAFPKTAELALPLTGQEKVEKERIDRIKKKLEAQKREVQRHQDEEYRKFMESRDKAIREYSKLIKKK